MKKIVIVGLLVFGIIMSFRAQCPAENNAFKSGEELDYELFFNWKFVWVKAGTANLKTVAGNYHGQSVYKTDLLAVSNKRADMFFKMRDTLTSVMSNKLEPIYFRKGAEEGKRYSVDEAWFSYPEGKSHAKQRKLRHNGEIVHTENTQADCIYDMLSILAQARSFDPTDFKVGQRISFPMVTGTKVEDQILIYKGKQNFTAEDDRKTTYRCLVFTVVENSKGKDRDIVTFYITDDENHLPVRLDFNLNFGSAKAFLKDVRNNRHPLTSIVKTKK